MHAQNLKQIMGCVKIAGHLYSSIKPSYGEKLTVVETACKPMSKIKWLSIPLLHTAAFSRATGLQQTSLAIDITNPTLGCTVLDRENGSEVTLMIMIS